MLNIRLVCAGLDVRSPGISILDFCCGKSLEDRDCQMRVLSLPRLSGAQLLMNESWSGGGFVQNKCHALDHGSLSTYTLCY